MLTFFYFYFVYSSRMMIVAHVVVADGDYVVVAAADAPAAAEIESNVIDWLRDDLHPLLSFLILFFHMMSLRLAVSSLRNG